MFLSEFPSWLGIVKCIGVRRSRWETRDSKRRKGKNLGKNLIPHLGKFEHLFIVRLFAGGPCGGQGNELARVGGGGFDPQPQSRSMEADASHRALPRQQSPHETPAQHLSAPEPQACGWNHLHVSNSSQVIFDTVVAVWVVTGWYVERLC